MKVTDFVAIGHYAGATCTLTSSVSLNEGAFSFEGSIEDTARIAEVLALQYNVYPVYEREKAQLAFDDLKAACALDAPLQTPESLERTERDERTARRFMSEGLQPSDVYGESVNANRIQQVIDKIIKEQAVEEQAVEEQAVEEQAVEEQAVEESVATVKTIRKKTN